MNGMYAKLSLKVEILVNAALSSKQNWFTAKSRLQRLEQIMYPLLAKYALPQSDFPPHKNQSLQPVCSHKVAALAHRLLFLFDKASLVWPHHCCSHNQISYKILLFCSHIAHIAPSGCRLEKTQTNKNYRHLLQVLAFQRAQVNLVNLFHPGVEEKEQNHSQVSTKHITQHAWSKPWGVRVDNRSSSTLPKRFRWDRWEKNDLTLSPIKPGGPRMPTAPWIPW